MRNLVLLTLVLLFSSLGLQSLWAYERPCQPDGDDLETAREACELSENQFNELPGGILQISVKGDLMIVLIRGDLSQLMEYDDEDLEDHSVTEIWVEKLVTLMSKRGRVPTARIRICSNRWDRGEVVLEGQLSRSRPEIKEVPAPCH